MPKPRLESLLRSLATEAGRPPPATLADLDSIARLEFVLAAEAEFGVEFTETELAGVRSLDDFARLLAARPAAPALAAAPADALAPASALPVLPGPAPLAGMLRAWFRLWYRLEVNGRDHLPATGACLLCANHASHLDSPALLAAARPRRADLLFPAARDYFFTAGAPARLARAALPLLPFEREGDIGGLRRNLRQLEAGRAAGRVLVLFPEGTRSADGRLQPFRPGLAFFAERLGVPVIPCRIDGTAAALPRGAAWPRPGRVRVTFGRPLPAAGAGGGERLAAAVAEALRA